MSHMTSQLTIFLFYHWGDKLQVQKNIRSFLLNEVVNINIKVKIINQINVRPNFYIR